MKKILAKIFPLLSLSVFLPQIASAATCNPVGTPGNITDVLCRINDILNIIIPILITLGVVYFIWGVIQYVTAKDEETKKAARSVMISGIIGLFVIVSIWGIIHILSNTFGTGSGGPSGYTPPTF